jgi:hypothetical protein
MSGTAGVGLRNVRGGIVLLSLGLAMGLLLSLYAFVPMVPHVPASLDQYDDLPRRLLRLAHIAAIMLPVINIVLGGWLDRLTLSARTKDLASRFLLWGAAGVPSALVLEACSSFARNVHVSAAPVLAFCGAVFAITLGAWRMPAGEGIGR